MISCLTDYIGLFSVTTPKSGVYLNRLQGIDTNQLNQIRDDETYDIEDAWDDIQNRAIDQFEQRVKQWAVKYYDNYSYIDNTVSGQYTINTAVPQGSNWIGWLFDGFFSYHKNMKLYIPSINLYTSNTVKGGTISIFNAVTGDVLDTITYSTTAGEVNNITINKEYQLHKLTKIFIAYDDSEVQTIIAKDFRWYWLGWGGPYATLNFTQRKIPKGSTVIKQNLSGVGNQGQGMIINYNIECSLDNFICQRLTLFQSSFLYLLGYEFCQERLFSDRINHYTLMNRDRAQELADVFLDRFNQQMDDTLNALRYDDWDFCFRCDREMNYRTLHP